MKKFTVLLMSLLILGCSDDDENDSHLWNIVFNETVLSDSHSVQKTEKFLYNNDQLIQHSVTQRYFNEEITQEVNLTYIDNQVIVTSENSSHVYTLNAEGYTTQCVYSTPGQNRTYLFTYSSEGYLTKIVENIDDVEFSTASFTYNNGDLVFVNSCMNDYESKFNYEPGKESTNYHLPCLGLLELHPLSFHIEALYAGLLGKDPRHLTIKSSPIPEENSDHKEYTQYSYAFDDKGNPTQMRCRTYFDGEAAKYYPNNRTISISME